MRMLNQTVNATWKYAAVLFFTLTAKILRLRNNWPKEADAALAEYIEKFQLQMAFQIAEIYAYRGETDKAFEWLERAYKQRDGGISEMKGDPLLRSLERDPRYRAFLQKMKLPI